MLAKHKISAPGLPGTSAKEMAVIFKLASQLKPEVSYCDLQIGYSRYTPFAGTNDISSEQ